jgi:transcriptional regulator with XRE-family HTH domain
MHVLQAPNRLAELREEAGMTQEALASALMVAPSTIYRWEARKVQISDGRRAELALLFGCSIARLMCWDESSEAVAA